MNAQQWYLLAAVLFAAGIIVLVVSQGVLRRWLKNYMRE